jgi:pilus assembly protein Flp/PilA
MLRSATSIRRFLESEEGPTAVEYAIMLALIILVCFIAIQALGSATNTTFSNVSANMSGS